MCIRDSTFGVASVTEDADEEGEVLEHTVTLTGTSVNDEIIPFVITNTTTSDDDYGTPTFSEGVTYDEADNEITIPAGVSEFTVSVPSTEDTNEENDEDYTLTVGTAEGIGTIENDDEVTVANNGVTSDSELEGESLEHTVTLTGTSVNIETFDFEIANDTTSDDDYGTPAFSEGVTDNGNGTITVPAGVSEFTVMIPSVDDTNEENDEDYTITVGGVSGIGTIENDDEVTIATITEDAKSEGNTLVHVVTLTGTSVNVEEFSFNIEDVTTMVTTDYATPPSFINGVTYDEASGVVSVPAGISTFNVSIFAEEDDMDEANETYTVSLGEVGATEAIEAIGEILDNDRAPNIAIADVTVTEGNDAEVEVSLTNPSSETIVIEVSITGGTADSPDDYTEPQTLELTFAPGDTSETITIPTSVDGVYEGDETVTLSAAATQGTVSNTATGTVTIEDADDAPVVEIADVTVAEDILLGVATLTAEITNGVTSATDITIEGVTVDNSAVAGTDYTTTTINLTIPAGDSSVTFTVPVISDTTYEGEENFLIDTDVTSGNTQNTEVNATVTITDEGDINACFPVGNNSTDTDGDGLTDCEEMNGPGYDDPNRPGAPIAITDPNDPCDDFSLVGALPDVTNPIWADADCDGDGVTNGTEYQPTGFGLDTTDPFEPCDFNAADQTLTSDEWNLEDCDGDGVTNGQEITDGTDIADSCDFELDSINKDVEDLVADCDGDGVTNFNEVSVDGTDPFDPCDFNIDNQEEVVTAELCIEVFNTISPNGYGNNKEMRINGLDKTKGLNNINIFNRWGVQVFETSDYENNRFKGISNGRVTIEEQEKLPSGTYYYVLHYTYGGKEYSKVGYLYIN